MEVIGIPICCDDSDADTDHDDDSDDNDDDISQDDADIQWKFSRTRMWMQYVDKGSDVPPPFNLLPNWKAIVSTIRWLCNKKKKDKVSFPW